MGASTVDLINGVISRSLDLVIQARLSFIAVEKPPAIDLTPVDPHSFWRESRVADPSPARVIQDKECFEGPGWRELELVGPSHGPGSHPGSREFVATAHVDRTRLGAGAPMVLLVHGYAVPFTGYDRWLAWRMRRLGAHTMRLDLPFHLRRSAPGRVSGDDFFSIDPVRTREVVRQSVEDAAALVAWARREVTPNVCVVGVSLGGLVSTLLATQVQLDGLIGVVPLCDPAFSFTRMPRGPMQRLLGMLGEGQSYWGRDAATAHRTLDGALAPLMARNFTPATPGDRITFVRALNDLIVGPQPVAALADAWGADLWTYPHGHITVMNARGIATRIRDRAVAAGAGSSQDLQLAG
jgi:hypothetical protein